MSTPVRYTQWSSRRLQLVLLVMVAWEVLNLAAELSFGGPLFKISGDKIGGLLAGRGSLNGAAVVMLVLYVYAFVRGPLRHRGILLIGVIEQIAATLFAVFHVAAGHVKAGSMIVPVAVSLSLLILILINLPRQEPD